MICQSCALRVIYLAGDVTLPAKTVVESIVNAINADNTDTNNRVLFLLLNIINFLLLIYI